MPRISKPASIGQCKHQTALIFWLLRRSEEPAPTELKCYWKKSLLSTIKNIKAKSVDELSGRNTDIINPSDELLKAFIEKGKHANQQAFVIRYSDQKNIHTLYMDHLMIMFKNLSTANTSSADSSIDINAANFVKFCSKQMDVDRCCTIFEETKEQNVKAEWYYQRFGRITASRLYEVCHCHTPDGSLVASIMGARGFKGNRATKRGQSLECEIFGQLSKTFKDIKKCGVIIRPDMPIFAASPDGMTDDYIFEIKCPSQTKTVKNYIENGTVKPKVNYQMQLQMFMSNKTKGYLCVADPEYEKNKKLIRIEVMLDRKLIADALQTAQKFWETVIFPNLQ